MNWLLVFSDHSDDRPPVKLEGISRTSLFDRFENDINKQTVQIFCIDDVFRTTYWCYVTEQLVDIKVERV